MVKLSYFYRNWPHKYASERNGWRWKKGASHNPARVQVASSQSGWSAPVLFDVKSLGVGVAAGVSTSNSLLIIDTDHAVNSFLHTQVCCQIFVALAGRQYSLAKICLDISKRGFRNVGIRTLGIIPFSFCEPKML